MPMNEPVRRGPHYEVHVADNFHYMDRDSFWIAGTFPTGEEALAKCKLIVEDSLEECSEPGRTGDEIYACYQSFGEDPFVVARNGATDVKFSAWDYAREKCSG